MVETDGEGDKGDGDRGHDGGAHGQDDEVVKMAMVKTMLTKVTRMIMVMAVTVWSHWSEDDGGDNVNKGKEKDGVATAESDCNSNSDSISACTESLAFHCELGIPLPGLLSLSPATLSISPVLPIKLRTKGFSTAPSVWLWAGDYPHSGMPRFPCLENETVVIVCILGGSEIRCTWTCFTFRREVSALWRFNVSLSLTNP